MKDALRFPGWELAEQNYQSQACQDLFVLAALYGLRGGYFLEIGASDGKSLSNTYLLEKFFDWSGVSVDIDIRSKLSFARHRRKSKFILHDATKLSVLEVLEQNIPGRVVDYLSLDIEPMTNTLSALKTIPFDAFEFKVITYETDFYDPAVERSVAQRVRAESREIISSHGYELIAADVCIANEESPFEDWWINPDHLPRTLATELRENFSNGQTGKSLLGVEKQERGAK